MGRDAPSHLTQVGRPISAEMGRDGMGGAEMERPISAEMGRNGQPMSTEIVQSQPISAQISGLNSNRMNRLNRVNWNRHNRHY